MTLARAAFLAGLGLLAWTPAVTCAQPTGSLVRGLDPDANAGAVVITSENRREVELVRRVTRDGSLSAEDLTRLLEATGRTANDEELEIVRLALQGKVPGGPDFEVPDETRQAAIDLLYQLNLLPASRQALEGGKTYGGTEVPATVKEVVARARLNGAVAYDVSETDEDGEGIYSHYPSITPATENMAFDWTEITPASLRADLEDTGEHLRVRGSETVTLNGESFNVARYTTMTGGTGSISAAYDEAFHPVRGMGRSVLEALGYPADLDLDAVRRARSSSGHRWASNCAILSDGSIHCLPAIRRHSANSGLILTNPSLARGHQLLWNGHLEVRAGKVVSIGTSGIIAKRAARGQDVFLNPIPLLEAWGFEMADGLEVTSEHATARPSLDRERAIMFKAAEAGR